MGKIQVEKIYNGKQNYLKNIALQTVSRKYLL